MIRFLLDAGGPIWTSNGISAKDYAQMIHDMGAALWAAYKWYHGI